MNKNNQAKLIAKMITDNNRNSDKYINELNSLILNSKIKFDNGKIIYPLWVECYTTGDGHIDNDNIQNKFGYVYVCTKGIRKNRIDITFGNKNIAISMLIKAAYDDYGNKLHCQSSIKNFVCNANNKPTVFKLEERDKFIGGNIANTTLVGISNNNINIRASYLADYCYIKTIEISE